jgi:signal transduction histidine kinase
MMALVVAWIRSWEWAATVLCLSVITVFAYDRVRDVIASRFFAPQRNSLEENTLQMLSEFIHRDWSPASITPDAETANREIQAVERIVESAESLSVSRRVTRALRARLSLLSQGARRLHRNLMGNAPPLSQNDKRVSQLGEQLKEVQLLLGDVRKNLRKRRSVRFSDEWNKLRDDMQPVLDTEGIDMKITFPDDLLNAEVHIKDHEFQHVFKNLYDNSIAALRAGADRRIDVIGFIDSVGVSIHWRDTGIGVPDDVREILFVQPVESLKPGGHGEGCFISRQIMKSRGGVIRIEDPSDGYSTVFVVKILTVT